MSSVRFNRGLLHYLQQSPTPFHATANLAGMLDEAGFTALDEGGAWRLGKGKRYYVVRNDSSIVAFKTGKADLTKNGLRLAGAHTDSPCLKVKPLPAVCRQGYLQLGVEVYGSALLQPWFDRDLSIAGRVHYQTGNKQAGGKTIKSTLIDLQKPVAFIPSLAIHLDRTANEGRAVNAQKELPPLLLQVPADLQSKPEPEPESEPEAFSFDSFLLDRVREVTGDKRASAVLAHELFLYDTQPPALVGLNDDFIASARLDNLLSCYLACRALIESSDEQASVLVCNDHEEVGSLSTSGAQGPFLKKVLERWVGASHKSADALERVLHRSTLFSIDNAHGVHPNYLEKHDDQHRPLLNAGPVIKINANQRYASNSQSVALFKSICQAQKVPYQSFVMRSDMACGSTIGPITAAELGVNTLDIGVPTFGMHSIRELAGSGDAALLHRVVTSFYNRD
ncbi:MAG: M18 family aminopeptidase [Pseudohongiellaceae bacterium]